MGAAAARRPRRAAGSPGRGRARGGQAPPRAVSDRTAERALGALACVVLALILGMIVFVFAKAWPSFEANGLGWFGSSGDVDRQLGSIFDSPEKQQFWRYELSTWPLLYGTALTTLVAVFFGLIFSLFAAIFIVEFAPPRLNRVLQPVVRLLAAVPSVIYGLIGILVLVPFVADTFISPERKESVAGIVQLTGPGWLVATVILMIMIVPIMIALIVDALRAVPSTWTEGAAALGANRWRVMWTIAVRTARPAIVAAAVLATARALGEAIMLSMVSGSAGFAPNPIDGFTFLFEPTRPLAATIVDNAEGLSVEPFAQTLYAFAAVLLISSIFLSVGGYLVKRPLRKYGVRP